jgi:hypothetical protein
MKDPMIKKFTLSFALFSAFSLMTVGLASAQIVLFDGSIPNGDQGFFSFGDFVVTDTADGVIIDNSAGDTSDGQGLFGGFGNNSFDPIDFDPSLSDLTIEFRFLEGDATGFFNVVLSDIDDADSAQDNQFTFDFGSAAPVGDGSGFLTQSIDLSVPASFRPTSFGFSDTGDDIFNPGLREVQIQSAFGSSDPMVLEVRSIVITSVPEPGSAALISLAIPALALRRRR